MSPGDPFEPRGPVIGHLAGTPIHDWLTCDGQRFSFDRKVLRDQNDEVDPAQLQSGELLVAPGFIYRPSEATP